MENYSNYINNPKEEEEPPIPLKLKILPVFLMCFQLYLFFYLIPIETAESYSTAIAVIGGFITVILSFWIAAVLLPTLFDDVPIFVSLTCISTLFIFGYLFILRTHNFATNELKENGVQTLSVVVDKSQWFGKRGRTTQDVDVAFYDENGVTQYATILVSKQEYSKFFVGKKIPIIYSTKHPTIASIDYSKLNRF